MAHFYEHVYASLRSAMIDRDHGDKLEDSVLVDFKSAQVALKKEIPSAALLISYSMLFYPKWLNDGRGTDQGLVPVAKVVEDFVGGTENFRFPLLFNIHMGMIAVAVGVYAGLWTVKYSAILQTVMINPNMDNPLVKETQRQIKNNELTYKNARELFVQLMQQEQYKGEIMLADDYVANAAFIEDASVSVEDDANEMIQQAIEVDFSKEFKAEMEKK